MRPFAAVWNRTQHGLNWKKKSFTENYRRILGFFQPPRKTKIGLKYWNSARNLYKITVFDRGEKKTFGSSYRKVSKREGSTEK